MIKLFKFFKGSAVICAILAPLVMILEVAMDLLQPTLLSNIIDIGVANHDLNYVLITGLKMIIAAIVGLFAGAGCSFLAAIAAIKLAEEVRQGLFDKIQTLSFLELDKLKTSSLITRLTNDVTQIQQMTNMLLRMMVRAPSTAIGGLVMAIILSKELSKIFVVAIPIILIVVMIILKKSFPLFKKMQQKIDNINLVMRESILGIKIIKALVIEDKQKDRFNDANEELTMASIKSQSMNLLLLPISTFIMNLTVVSVLWFGGNMFVSGNIEIGKIMAFINYLLQIMASIMMVINCMIMFSRAQVSAARINEVLDTKTSIENKENCEEVKSFDIEFKNVFFKYNDHSDNVLEDISVKIKEGEKVGIIGSTGCGKTSFVNLIPRLYDATSGEILIGGVNVKNINIKQLREDVAIVLQESILFSGDIKSNLKLGNKNASEEELISASKDSQAYEFIMNKDNKFDEVVEQRGKNLSGGQKQRLSVARGVARNPEIFIFDDTFSALDYKTDLNLRKQLKTKMKDNTVLIIAQRISAVMDLDKIIVMDDGKISDMGSHKELLERSEIYRSIAVSQLGEEVLVSV